MIKWCETKRKHFQGSPLLDATESIHPVGGAVCLYFQWRGLWLRGKSLSRNRTDWDQILPGGLVSESRKMQTLRVTADGLLLFGGPLDLGWVLCGPPLREEAAASHSKPLCPLFCRFSMPPLRFAFSRLVPLMSYTRWNGFLCGNRLLSLIFGPKKEHC